MGRNRSRSPTSVMPGPSQGHCTQRTASSIQPGTAHGTTPCAPKTKAAFESHTPSELEKSCGYHQSPSSYQPSSEGRRVTSSPLSTLVLSSTQAGRGCTPRLQVHTGYKCQATQAAELQRREEKRNWHRGDRAWMKRTKLTVPAPSVTDTVYTRPTTVPAPSSAPLAEPEPLLRPEAPAESHTRS
jgi:hypothetical protein